MKHSCYNKDEVLVDISQPQSCVSILMKRYDNVNPNTAHELYFQSFLSMSIERTSALDRTNIVVNPSVLKKDGSSGPGTMIQIIGQKVKRDGLICVAQLLHTYGGSNAGGKVSEQCPHGKQCIFVHVEKKKDLKRS